MPSRSHCPPALGPCAGPMRGATHGTPCRMGGLPRRCTPAQSGGVQFGKIMTTFSFIYPSRHGGFRREAAALTSRWTGWLNWSWRSQGVPAQGHELEDWESWSWSPALLSLLILMVPEEPVSQVCQSAVQSWKGLSPDTSGADLTPHFLLPMAGAGWDMRSGGSSQKLTGSDLEVEQNTILRFLSIKPKKSTKLFSIVCPSSSLGNTNTLIFSFHKLTTYSATQPRLSTKPGREIYIHIG